MNLLIAILIQAPTVPAPQSVPTVPVSNIIVERFGLPGEIKMEYYAPDYKNIYF